ncbi:MAG TPA: TolC family protein [Phycisphaerae bacterium]|nr:TolC family protein [Phycisphaerales bacterium]HRX85224.1 TolC family protein [Phycisphaerae bacterium]
MVSTAWAQVTPDEPNDAPVIMDADGVEIRAGDMSERFGDEDAGTNGAYDASFIERLQKQLPDPEDALAKARVDLDKSGSKSEREVLERMIERISQVQEGRQVRLTLEDVLRRALAHSLAVRVSSYDPAIETTRVVEAEAAFDAAFFTNITNNKQNRPATNALSGTNVQAFNASSGLRKLLPSGMQVETSYVTSRTSNDFAFQTINPVWFSQFVTQFRQPLLRGFGLDFNRSQIHINKLSRRRAMQQFRRQVQDTLRQTEEAYWQLVQARRNVVISARVLASFEQIFSYLDARKEFDVYRIQLADTRARLERTRAQFIELVALVRDAEDRLIALMNDPEINLTDDIEVVPVIAPHFARIQVDRVAEVQAALDNRPEIVEARLNIDAARIQVGVAKNQALPQLDLVFRYSVDGLGRSHDRAFSEVTKNDYNEYYIGIDFELPVGNRARRAALRRAKLQYAQSIASLKQVFEQVILDVNQAVRRLETRYDQIDPALQSVEATEDQVASIKARAEKKDFLTLNTELNTEQSLAQSRRDLLTALVDYGVAIIDLERAKGTLLQYNRVELMVDDGAEDPVN